MAPAAGSECRCSGPPHERARPHSGTRCTSRRVQVDAESAPPPSTGGSPRASRCALESRRRAGKKDGGHPSITVPLHAAANQPIRPAIIYSPHAHGKRTALAHVEPSRSVERHAPRAVRDPSRRRPA
ncbi:hypothetical protein HPB47_010739 [Ixodes persulcatus]|uniref:Uncharacterized protein n=1 Tax=Ixodes persulcatus TaxID=34615 RepID=A0AC60NYH5_IXOPE|nr:hypothetical protein HPB47_010739 [Ixodes persulcatus]